MHSSTVPKELDCQNTIARVDGKNISTVLFYPDESGWEKWQQCAVDTVYPSSIASVEIWVVKRLPVREIFFVLNLFGGQASSTKHLKSLISLMTLVRSVHLMKATDS